MISYSTAFYKKKKKDLISVLLHIFNFRLKQNSKSRTNNFKRVLKCVQAIAKSHFTKQIKTKKGKSETCMHS